MNDCLPRPQCQGLSVKPLFLRWICLALAAAFFSAAVGGAPCAAAESYATGAEGQRLVHVGFFRFDGYHSMDAAGDKTGYGYDFLQMIAGYANFKYIYVGYQKTWNDMLDMLDDGEIDLLTYAVKTPSYEARFDFSTHSIGSCATLLTTSVDSAVFAEHDYQPFDGMRVGMIRNANRQEAFDAYAAGKNLSYTPVYYDDIDGLEAALQAGKDIDAMIADEFRVLTNETIIDRLDTHDLYVMVKKGNAALLQTIDEAIRRLDAANPGWALELQSLYFSPTGAAGIPVTLSESQYIDSLKSAGSTLRVLFNPARYPLSYYQDGQARGVLVDLFRGIAAAYGLPYEFVPLRDIDAYDRLRKNGEADIVLDFAESTDEAEVQGYRLTLAYADSSYAVVTAAKSSGVRRNVAVIHDSGEFLTIAQNDNARARIQYYDSFGDCVQAVRDGTADCAYMYSLTAQMFVIEDNSNSIHATQMNNRAFHFRLAVNADADMRLYGLLNKATHQVSEAETEKLYNAYLLEAKRNYTFWDYLVNKPFAAVSIVAAVLAVLLGFLLAQRRSARKLKISNDALVASRGELEKALAAANDANAAKTKFLSQMSHDIRTPLNGIVGMTAIAREHADDPARVADALAKIARSSDHLGTLINDILDLSRIESGKMVIAHEPTDLQATIDQCVEMLKNSVIDRGITVVTHLEPLQAASVLTDSLHVRQILINIISNAVKFTPDGGTITFQAGGRLDEAGRTLLCRFEIDDTGIGMSAEFLKHIFEAFVQADDFSARSQYRGSGLGMSIVRQFVDMLGGNIAIRSEEGKGTAVVVELPFAVDPAAAAHSAQAADGDAGRAYHFANARVLLAEDNAINLEIARTILESRGFTVDPAEDGQVAVKRFAASGVGAYQCILMDIRMPNMNGYDATRKIRALDRPDAQTVPIIAMTANAFAEDVQAALASGMNAHVAKPIDIRILMETLAKCLAPSVVAGAASPSIPTDGAGGAADAGGKEAT